LSRLTTMRRNVQEGYTKVRLQTRKASRSHCTSEILPARRLVCVKNLLPGRAFITVQETSLKDYRHFSAAIIVVALGYEFKSALLCSKLTRL
jgi:hypothetical protein